MFESQLLKNIHAPDDLKKLDPALLPALCADIRQTLIETVSQTGGHLASNLGVVELTVALHRIFDSPTDQMVFDVGHQIYTHKILTGRYEQFPTLRQEGGISGFSRPNESVHDIFYSGHSSTSISSACGLARAKALQYDNSHVIAVIGDGALTGGLAFAGLQNAARSKDNLIVILNDNKMSINRNVGSVARYLARIRLRPSYFHFKDRLEKLLNHIPWAGKKINDLIFKGKSLVKNAIYHSTFFEEMGFYYMGPIDGHDIPLLCRVLERAKSVKRPIFLHIHTLKGKGYSFAEANPKEFHGISRFDIENGEPIPPSKSYSDVFGEYLCELAEKDSRICAVTAAMTLGTGLTAFSKQYKDHFFDVGICEEHAITFASGLAKNGMLPVFAVYSTFLQRGYDQLIHDAALQNLKIVLCIDRAGFVGEDGETHQGLFDVGFLNSIPNIKVLAPSNYAELKNDLCNALYSDAGVVAVRYPRGVEKALPDNYEMSYDTFSLYGPTDAKVVLATYGRLFAQACEACEKLKAQGIEIAILKLNQIKPVDVRAVQAILPFEKAYFFEESLRHGGVAEVVAAMLFEQNYQGEYHITAVPDTFVMQASIPSLLQRYSLHALGMSEKISGQIPERDA